MDDIHRCFNLAGTPAMESHICATGCDRVAVCAFFANFGSVEDSEQTEPDGTVKTAVDGIYEYLATGLLPQIRGELGRGRAVDGKPRSP
jgi:hypothetical protein